MISSIFVASLLFLSSVVADSTCARTATVADGDYCDLISAKYNSSTYQLAVSNYQTINDGCTNLEVGQTVCLGIKDQDCAETYIVKAGDSCWAIAQSAGLTNTTLLMSNNPQIDDTCSNIYVGEVLCIAKTSLVTPAPSGWTLPGSTSGGGGSDGAAAAKNVKDTTVKPAAGVNNAVSDDTQSTDDTTDNTDDNCEDDTTDTGGDDGECDDTADDDTADNTDNSDDEECDDEDA